MSNFPCKRGQ